MKVDAMDREAQDRQDGFQSATWEEVAEYHAQQTQSKDEDLDYMVRIGGGKGNRCTEDSSGRAGSGKCDLEQARQGRHRREHAIGARSQGTSSQIAG